MTHKPTTKHRLDGLEPDNLLAFLALLGLLRALEAAQPDWRPRVSWDLDCPPLRPVLHVTQAVVQDEVSEAAAEGVATLASAHAFAGRADLNYDRKQARDLLDAAARSADRARADLLAALMSDGAVKDDKDQVEATPLCLLFGQGHQHFLDRFAAVPNRPSPPPRGRGKKAVELTAAECLGEALFATWTRPDETFAFRWDPAEDVRYALLADDPSSQKTRTQHGANRLAAVGLAALTVAPVVRGTRVRLRPIGGSLERTGFAFAWPIWREPASLAAIRALLAHPNLREPEKLDDLGVEQVMDTSRMSVGKFMNFSWARPIGSSTL
jgi:hypothetical protein